MSTLLPQPAESSDGNRCSTSGPSTGQDAHPATDATSYNQIQDSEQPEQHNNIAYGGPDPGRGYDLLYYLNTTPLRGALLNNEENNGDGESQTATPNQNVVIRILLLLHLAMVIFISSLILWEVVGYKRPWHEMFDRPSEVLIFTWLVRILVKTCIGAWIIRYQCMRAVEPTFLFHSRRLYKVFTWLWISASAFFLIIRPRENLHSTTCKVSFLLMWLTFAWNISPVLAYAMLSILLYPILSLIIRYRTQGGLTAGLPKKLYQKLEVERFDKVVARINRGELKRSRTQNSSKESRSQSNNSVSVVMASEPGDDQESPKAEALPSPQSTNTALVLDKVCAICILEIASKEKIFVMPCDMRHFFHRECLKTWFKRSRMCPICRVNIGNALTKEGANSS